MSQKPPELDLYERLMSVGGVKPTAPSEGSAREKELVKADPDYSVPVSLRNLFTHHDTHPVVLDYALLRAFGVKWLSWLPETLWVEIQHTFKTQVSEHNRAKIQAVKACHVTDSPWVHWQVFEKVIQAVNNNVPRFDLMQKPTLEQLYAGVDIMNTLRHEEFSTEVKLYMAAAVLEEDVFFVPPPLDFIQNEVAQPYYVCRDCHNADSALFHDGYCDVCTKKFDPEQGLSMSPKEELVKAGKGKNLTLVLRHNPAEAKTRWEQVKDKPTSAVEFEESHADVQVAKLLIARDYLNIRRRQLGDQLSSLRTWLESK